jgi:hypothetical protein
MGYDGFTDLGEATCMGKSRTPVQRRTPAQRHRARPVTITVYIPFETWRLFQIQLLLKHDTMQEWVARKIGALTAQPVAEIEQRALKRLERRGPMKQVIARIDRATLRSAQLRLAAMATPMSAWLFYEIQNYIKGLNLAAVKE